MVDGQLIVTTAAVLAGVVVPLEEVATRQGQLTKGNANVLAQADHRWQVGALTQLPTGVVFQTLGLALQHHHHSPSPGGDIERLVGRIENENLAHASSLNNGHAIGDVKLSR
jgi:acyl-coenzyme A thioesterase PaaI-like protein